MNRWRWEVELLEGLWWQIANAIRDYTSCHRQVRAIARNAKERRATSAQKG